GSNFELGFTPDWQFMVWCIEATKEQLVYARPPLCLYRRRFQCTKTSTVVDMTPCSVTQVRGAAYITL
ncbi:hypothetical protein PC122_g21020, partial [Phytophthora cactorum]